VQEPRSTSRQLKEHLRQILSKGDWEREFLHLVTRVVRPQKTISPLFAALYSTSPTIRWHAVSCFGLATAELARQGREHVRVVLRRCTWNLNDESGGIGWGSPEAIAEILAHNPSLSEEYASILVSLILEREQACNFLEYAPLREGAYWGIARLAQAQPDLIRPWQEHILDAATCESFPFILGGACLIVSNAGIASERARQFLHNLRSRRETFLLYWNKAFWNVALGDLARDKAPPQSAWLQDQALA
jgi:hypothetical protein